jgi:4'-phosphopantetheinyl transferase
MRDPDLERGNWTEPVRQLTDEPGTVDLWAYFPGTDHNEELLTAQAALLSGDERERSRRFHFERDRRLYVAKRALVRTVLSSYFTVAPGDWVFSRGERGKPSIAYPIPTCPLHFNLARTEGLVVCLVGSAHTLLGVDAELLKAGPNFGSLAESYFSVAESQAIRACPVSRQAQLFFTYWTLKESYAKSRGDGLRLALDRFSFHLRRDEIAIALDPSLADDGNSWRFALLEAPSNHLVAVAVKSGGAPLNVRIKETMPLRKAPENTRLRVRAPSDFLK